MNNELFYKNKKGKIVKLKVKKHAYNRFLERYKKIAKVETDNISETFKRVFLSTNKVKNLNKYEKKRLKRYGKDTLFFRTNGITFIVQNASIVTVEISDKNKRYLN